jgi:hypothetical protein
MCHHQKVGENHNIKFGNKRLKCVAELKCEGTVVTDQN